MEKHQRRSLAADADGEFHIGETNTPDREPGPVRHAATFSSSVG
jgi:hypothetical protein